MIVKMFLTLHYKIIMKSRKTSKEPKTICSTSAKRKHAPRVESKDYEAVSSDDASSSSLDQQPCSLKSRGSSSLAVKGSNALM